MNSRRSSTITLRDTWTATGGKPTEMETTGMNGLKLSKELVQIRFQRPSVLVGQNLDFLEKLTDNKINIAFLSWVVANGEIQLSCCIAPEDYYQVLAILASQPGLKELSSIKPSVCLLSLFPHKNRLQYLAQSLNVLIKLNLPIYGLASSLSSITFVTDYRRSHDTKNTLKTFLSSGL
ncbi:MAG: hypothetical protein JW932_02155 [Deltaproteobacteria bacterium]|nr:hypothetical protein [Deltaproteobacteria bacterium]